MKDNHRILRVVRCSAFEGKFNLRPLLLLLFGIFCCSRIPCNWLLPPWPTSMFRLCARVRALPPLIGVSYWQGCRGGAKRGWLGGWAPGFCCCYCCL